MRNVATIGDTSDITNPTQAFEQAVQTSHALVSRADILFNREVIAQDVPVVNGQVITDRTARIRGRATVTIADPTRIPAPIGDRLSPYGYEIRLWRGIRTPKGGALLVAVGTFPIQRSTIDAVTGVTRLECEDRGRLVSDARFEDNYQIASGTNYAAAIETMIDAGAAGLTYNFPSTTFTTPLLTFASEWDDRWSAAQDMGQSIGNDLYFDGFGECTMTPEPTFTLTPVAQFNEGSNLVDAIVQQDRRTAYNRVIAYSSNSSLDQVYRGVATDNDSSSPTYYFGPFGKRPRFYASPFLASTAQATSAAESVLNGQLGVARSVSVTAIPDPRIEPGDVVVINRASLGLSNSVNIVESVTLSLGPETAMTLSVRSNQEV